MGLGKLTRLERWKFALKRARLRASLCRSSCSRSGAPNCRTDSCRCHHTTHFTQISSNRTEGQRCCRRPIDQYAEKWACANIALHTSPAFALHLAMVSY